MNCGPIEDGDDYCLFHKPDKSEDEARKFYIKLKDQAIKEIDEGGIKKFVFSKLDWGGYIFPKTDRTTFMDAIFEGDADFFGATFEGDADFFGATFDGKTNFGKVTFKERAIFWSAIFKDLASFVEVNFEGEAGLMGTVFKKSTDFINSSFEGKADFAGSTFKERGNFWLATFKDVTTFEGSTFGGEVDFGRSSFKGKTDFGKVKFEGEAEFVETIFEGEADFERSFFEGDADFGKATFVGDAGFKGAIFSSATNFSKGTCHNEISFEGALLERRCSFENRKFGGKLLFINTEFRQGVVMEKDWENPEPEKYKLPQAEQEGCRVQKLSFEKEGKKEAAEAIFVREMRARRKDIESQYEREEGYTVCHKKTLWDKRKPLLRRFRWDFLVLYITTKAEYIFVDLLSEYGTNWKRVVGSSIVLIFVFAFLYFFGDIRGVKSVWDLVYYSIAAFTSLGYGDLNPVGWARTLSGIQSLIGAFFIALFVVVFARRWMR